MVSEIVRNHLGISLFVRCLFLLVGCRGLGGRVLAAAHLAPAPKRVVVTPVALASKTIALLVSVLALCPFTASELTADPCAREKMLELLGLLAGCVAVCASKDHTRARTPNSACSFPNTAFLYLFVILSWFRRTRGRFWIDAT